MIENWVVANGDMSEEQNVISNIPHGTVLPTVFSIMISDIDENVKMCLVVWCFTYEKRVNIKIGSKIVK